jgi:WD40 repeat protein
MSNTWITALDFREGGDLFLVAGGDSVRVCQTDPLGELVSLSYPRSVVNAACFGPEDLVVAGYADRAVVFWDWRRARRLSVIFKHRDEVTALALSPNKQRLVSAGRDGDVNVWDVPPGKPVATLAEHRDGVYAAAWCSRSPYVVTGGGHADQRGDTKIRLWDTQAARCVRAFEAHESAIVALAASPNGRFVASADRQGLIRIWEYDRDLEF